MALETGRVLQGRYRIISLLGRGGMGAVYRAWDDRLNIPVAIKEMTSQPGLNPRLLAQLREQFRQEAQVLARLHHPHLVRVGDFFEEEENAYLVMDFVAGENLAALIEHRGPLPERQVLVWADQLLDALNYCHGQGVIHRDIKPQNVIIRSDGQTALVDFGLVKLWDPQDPRTKTAMRGMGTPEYAPPEQYETDAGHTDSRSDIYSLGATLYHALSGQAPPTATLRMADPERFLPLDRVNPAVSSRTSAAVMKALELARSRRWQNAAEMAQGLGLARQPFTVAAGQEPAGTPPAPPTYGGETRVIPGKGQPDKSTTTAPLPTQTPVRRRWDHAIPWVMTGMVLMAVVLTTLSISVRRVRVKRWHTALTATAAVVRENRAATAAVTPTPQGTTAFLPVSTAPARPPTATTTRPPTATTTRPPTATTTRPPTATTTRPPTATTTRPPTATTTRPPTATTTPLPATTVTPSSSLPSPEPHTGGGDEHHTADPTSVPLHR